MSPPLKARYESYREFGREYISRRLDLLRQLYFLPQGAHRLQKKPGAKPLIPPCHMNPAKGHSTRLPPLLGLDQSSLFLPRSFSQSALPLEGQSQLSASAGRPPPLLTRAPHLHNPHPPRS